MPAPGQNDQIPTRAAQGVVPPMLNGMHPAAREAVARGLEAAEQAGFATSISKYGGYRSPAMQKALYRHRGTNPNPVAPPGESEHQQGIAVDIASGGGIDRQRALAKLLKPYGLTWAGESDPVHFTFTGPTGAGDAPIGLADLARKKEARLGITKPAPQPKAPRPSAPMGLAELARQKEAQHAAATTPRPVGAPAQRPQTAGQRPATGEPQIQIGGRARPLSQFQPAQEMGVEIRPGAVSPFAPTVDPFLMGKTAADVAMMAPGKMDDVLNAVVNRVVHHVRRKGLAALGRGETWTDIRGHAATALKPKHHVPLQAFQELGEVKPGEKGFRAGVGRAADAILGFWFAPSNLVYGPLMEHTVGPAVGAVAREYGGALLQGAEERIPAVARAAEQVRGAVAGRKALRAEAEARARLQHEGQSLAVQIRRWTDQAAKNPKFAQEERAFFQVHGRTRMQELATLYTHDPELALRRASEEGIDPAAVEKFGRQMEKNVHNVLNESTKHGKIKSAQEGGAHFLPGSEERNKFIVSYADRIFGRKGPETAEEAAARAGHPAREAQPLPPKERVPPWERAQQQAEQAPPPPAEAPLHTAAREALAPEVVLPPETEVPVPPAGKKPQAPLKPGQKPLGPLPSTAGIIPGQKFDLPASLRGAKPRYGYGRKLFTLQFESELDKALYIVSGAKWSRADSHFMHLLRAYYPDLSAEEIRNLGLEVRNRIKGMARDAEQGTLVVPKSGSKAAETALTSAAEAAPAAGGKKPKTAAEPKPAAPAAGGKKPKGARPAAAARELKDEEIEAQNKRAAKVLQEKIQKTRRQAAAQEEPGKPTPTTAGRKPKATVEPATKAPKPARERGELGNPLPPGMKPTLPLDISRPDVPAGAQHTIARLFTESRGRGIKLAKKFGVDEETAAKWAKKWQALEKKAEEAPETAPTTTREPQGRPAPVANAVRLPSGKKVSDRTRQSILKTQELFGNRRAERVAKGLGLSKEEFEDLLAGKGKEAPAVGAVEAPVKGAKPAARTGEPAAAAPKAAEVPKPAAEPLTLPSGKKVSAATRELVMDVTRRQGTARGSRVAEDLGLSAEEYHELLVHERGAAPPGEAKPPKGFRKGSINLFASSAERAGAPPPVARTMAVSAQAGSEEGYRAVDALARQHGLEAAAGTGLARDVPPGGKPAKGWVKIPDDTRYGELAGKQVPQLMGDAIRNIADASLPRKEAAALVDAGKKAWTTLVRGSRLAMLHPLLNTTGLAVSMAGRLVQMEIGLERGLAQSLAGKGFGEQLGRGALAPAEALARMGPSLKRAAADLGRWLHTGEESEKMKALRKEFPTAFAQLEQLGELRAAALASRGTRITGKAGARAESRAFIESGASLHGLMDQWAKLALFDALTRRGLSDEAAAKIVKTHLFDYSDDLAIFHEANRTGLWVFNAVPRKQAALALRTLIERPDLAARFPRLRDAIFAMQPGSQEDYEQNVPEYRKGPFVVPWGQDKQGRWQYKDFGRFIPFAGLFSLLQPKKPGLGDEKRTPLDKILSIPLWGPAVGALFGNRDVRTGYPIKPEGAPPEASIFGIPASQWQAAAEMGLPPNVRTYQRLQRAKAGTTPSPSPAGEPQTMGEAVSQSLGVPAFRGGQDKDLQKKLEARTAEVTNYIYGKNGIGMTYKEGKSPNTYRKRLENATVKDLGRLNGMGRGLLAYSFREMSAARNYDAKGQLTKEGKERAQNIFLWSMALQEKIEALQAGQR